uniref:Uncharacterized protein n=1 Tax=Kwoniella dejecticola CBS 10117 TaxID=1296121 RepID=A0A1A5ZYP5_9TREE|nr:uncharacterized protein I303_06486 [Kwoniella dejecticola CBS 10117]OBR82928.1 hypothetical protein I303_06486 [Kwoniella dejecticola CBS 10117]
MAENLEESRSSVSSPGAKRPSILPRRDSLPPPLRSRSDSSTSYTSFESAKSLNDHKVYEATADNSIVPLVSSLPSDAVPPTEAEMDDSDRTGEGVFDILKDEEIAKLNTLSRLEGNHRITSKHGLKHLDLDLAETSNMVNHETTDRQIPKTPRTPKRFIQDHITIKTPRLPVPLTAARIPIPVPIPTHVNLPTPVMPVIHLLLIVAHLILSALIPFLLFKNFIQPLVFGPSMRIPPSWYSLRSYRSSKTSTHSGLHIVIMVLSLIPHGGKFDHLTSAYYQWSADRLIKSATVFLLIVSDQIPECPSALIYRPPALPNFESHLRWSTCKQLPKVTLVALVNVIIVSVEIIVAGMAVTIDYRIQRQEERRHSVDVLEEIAKARKRRRRKTWWKDDPNDEIYHKMRRRRWTAGTGKLLWDIEGYIHRKKAKESEEKAV